MENRKLNSFISLSETTGNIEADANGVAKVSIQDHLVSLTGQHSIIGRALVVSCC